MQRTLKRGRTFSLIARILPRAVGTCNSVFRTHPNLFANSKGRNDSIVS